MRPGAADFFVPADALRGARLDTGIAGKVLAEGGLLVVTWAARRHAARLRLPRRPRAPSTPPGRRRSTTRVTAPSTDQHDRKAHDDDLHPRSAKAPAVLVLEDGRTFRGRAYGAVGETFGEAVFATGMTGYQETLTDPSYHRQIVVMTAPHIGNTGVNDEDPESAPDLGRRLRRARPRPRALQLALPALPRRRAASRRASSASAASTPAPSPATCASAAPCASASSPATPLRRRRRRCSRRCAGRPADGGRRTCPREVATEEAYVVPADRRARRFTVAALDLGIKGMTPHRLAERGIEVHVLPADRHGRGRLRGRARRRVLLQRPRRPGAPPTHAVELHARASSTRACRCFGICFGNQLLGRALGFGTYKLKYGHRGINQPVQDRTTGKVEITAHNHGFAVDAPARRGLRHPVRPRRGRPRLPQRQRGRGPAAASTGPAFSVQYHPEAAAGPHDAAYLFDRFVDALDGGPAMPKRTDIQSVLVIGSGPIVIGQAAEFDYSGTQACRVLQGRGPAGHPGQLQPGDDHDRPGDRRRHLRRADHPRVRREDHRQGAPRRAAARPSAARPR